MIQKCFKWGKSFLRVLLYRVKYKGELVLDYSINKKPVYFGNNVKIYIDKGCSLKIGGGTYFSDNCKIFVMDSANCKIGNHVYWGNGCKLMLREELTIGDDCLFAENVSFYDHNHDYKNHNVGFTCKRIIIGKECWFSTNVVVTAGSIVGDKVVVGANAVVNGFLDANNVYVTPKAEKLISKK